MQDTSTLHDHEISMLTKGQDHGVSHVHSYTLLRLGMLDCMSAPPMSVSRREQAQGIRLPQIQGGRPSGLTYLGWSQAHHHPAAHKQQHDCGPTQATNTAVYGPMQTPLEP